MENTPRTIGTLNEQSLHADLKAWYAEPGDQFEVAIEGFVVDIVRGDRLVEIQTRNFSAIRHKLAKLLQSHDVRLVHPMTSHKWILKLPTEQDHASRRRKSPKRCGFVHVFDELVSIPRLITHPGFSIELVLIHEEEIRRSDGGRSWRRRGWSTCGRRLLKVTSWCLLETPADLMVLLPVGLDEPFTTSDLARATQKPLRLAQRMAYCLREVGSLIVVGKHGNAFLYARDGLPLP
ncbi:MAG: hypothetical protein PVF70_07985 [Anaerolineales bacterium]|jgi:hypothetical protein